MWDLIITIVILVFVILICLFIYLKRRRKKDKTTNEYLTDRIHKVDSQQSEDLESRTNRNSHSESLLIRKLLGNTGNTETVTAGSPLT